MRLTLDQLRIRNIQTPFSDYVHSFLNIRDPEIEQMVKDELKRRMKIQVNSCAVAQNSFKIR